MKPRSVPLTAVACIHVISFAHTAAHRILNSRDIEYPGYRFRPYNTLDEEAISLAFSLGYDEHSWNSVGTNPWEQDSYESIQSNAPLVIASIRGLGFTADVWDCYMNHYRDYSWQELADDGVILFAILLGWNEDMWDTSTSPAMEYMFWDDLTIGEQQAAVEFCFTKEQWDNIPLQDWDSLSYGMNRSTLIPTSTPSRASTETKDPVSSSPSLTPIDNINSPSVAPISNSAIASESSSIPTVQHSISPETISPSPSPTPELQPTTWPTATHPDGNVNLPSIPPVDDIRYVLWDNLPERQKEIAIKLEYDSVTWNSPGTADIEYYSIASLDNDDDEAHISQLGFSNEQWDCYVHHYISFSWDMLENIGVVRHFILLGWSKSSWEGEIEQVPASEEKTWNDLTDDERAGATGLCYLFQTWDGYSLDDKEWAVTAPDATQKVQPGNLPPVPLGIGETSSSGRRTTVTLSLLVAIASLIC